MAALVTNKTQAEALDAASMTSATVGGADAAMPGVSLSFTKGIDGTTNCAQLSNETVSLTAGNHYSAHISFGGSSYDLSAVDQAFFVHFKNNSPSYTTIETNSDSLRVGLFSGGGTTNWGRWEYDPTDMIDGVFNPVAMFGTPDTTGGTFDDTDVTGFFISLESDTTGGAFGFQASVDQLIYINGPVVFEDTGAAATVTLVDFYDLLKPTSGTTYHSMLVSKAGPTIEVAFPVDFQCDDYDDTSVAVGLACKEADGKGFPAMPSGYFQFNWTPPASSTQIFQNLAAATNSTDFDTTIDASAAGCSLTFESSLFAGVNDAVIGGANVIMTGCTLASPATCDISDGDLELTINDCTAAIQWTSDLVAGSTITTDSDIDITFSETDISDISLRFTASNTATLSPSTGSGTYDLSDTATTGTINFDNSTANDTTVTLPSGTSTTVESPTAGGGDVTIDSPAVTYTFNSDTATTLIRYFEDDSQTVVDSATGTTLAYEFPDSDPVDAEFVKQSYVPLNRQDVVPTDGGTLDIIMDFDEAYNSSHGLTITTEYDYVRATKVITINSDQEALDVRSSLADVIRTNSSYYNTPLLMEAIPGLTRVDLINGATITSMATWKGAGCEVFDAADSANPIEKWFAIKSVGTITGATTHYRQTDSGNSTAVTLTSNIVNEAFQYWDDPNHDGSTADGYDYSDYMVIKSFLAGSKQGRVDVLANAGISALASNLYTVPISNPSHDYSGSDPGISADITLVSGSTVGGVAFSYEIEDGGTNTGADIADQINYNAANNPNTVIPGGTGLRYFELPDMVIYNAAAVETERGYEEGTTPALVGFYVSRGGSDHPSFTRFQGDNGTYYTPATVAQISAPNVTVGRIQICNETGRAASSWASSTAYSEGDYVLRTTGAGTELGDGVFFVCTTAGTSGGSEPTWDVTDDGDTTVDNTVTWTVRPIEFDNTTTTSGYSNSWTDGEHFASVDTIRMRWVDEDDLEISSNGVATTDGTTTFLDTPEDDTVYDGYGVDGSTVTEYSADYPNVQVDVTDPDNVFYIDRFYAWHKYNLTLEDGIRNFFGAISATDTSNVTINNSVVDIFFDNTKAGSARQGDQIVISRADGVYPQVTTTSGGGGLGFYYTGIGYSTSSGSGLDTTERNKLLGLYDYNPTTKVLENGITDEVAMKLMLAEAAGEVEKVSDTNYKFKSQDGITDRIDAVVNSSGERTSVTVDGS